MIPEYPSRSFQHEGGARTVPWEDWASLRQQALDETKVWRDMAMGFEAQIERLTQAHEQWVRDHQRQTDHDQREILRLKRVLEFYASGGSWCHPESLDKSAAVEDRGERASAALNPPPSEGNGQSRPNDN